MTRHVAIAVLVDGPHDGCRDGVLLPAPEVIVWAWCPNCRRSHIAGVESEPWPEHTYVRDPAASGGRMVVYRHVDLDDELDELVYATLLEACAT